MIKLSIIFILTCDSCDKRFVANLGPRQFNNDEDLIRISKESINAIPKEWLVIEKSLLDLNNKTFCSRECHRTWLHGGL